MKLLLACTVVSFFFSCLFLLNYVLEACKCQRFLLSLYLLTIHFPFKWTLRYITALAESTYLHFRACPIPIAWHLCGFKSTSHAPGEEVASHLSWKPKQMLWRRKRFWEQVCHASGTGVARCTQQYTFLIFFPLPRQPQSVISVRLWNILYTSLMLDY